MKRTLKRELKVFEIVESDAFVVSVCLIFNFFLNLWRRYPLLCHFGKVKLGTAG